MKEWQEGLVSYEHLSGESGQVGAKAKLGGFMKVIGWIMPGSFKKQSFKFMKMFKDLAEQQ